MKNSESSVAFYRGGATGEEYNWYTFYRLFFITYTILTIKLKANTAMSAAWGGDIASSCWSSLSSSQPCPGVGGRGRGAEGLVPSSGRESVGKLLEYVVGGSTLTMARRCTGSSSSLEIYRSSSR